MLREKREREDGFSVYAFSSPTGGPLCPDRMFSLFVMLQKIRLITDEVLAIRHNQIFQKFSNIPQIRFALLMIAGHLIEVSEDPATSKYGQRENQDNYSELEA